MVDHMNRNLQSLLRATINPLGHVSFLRRLPRNARLLDVGCGNESPSRVKRYRPDVHYTGIDIGDHNQTASSLSMADKYIVVPPATFAQGIETLGETRFDAVVSRHNFEHCLDPDAVLSAMIRSLVPGGLLYMAFPCEASVNFPSRGGTLNFWDDPTHVRPPNWARTMSSLKSQGMVLLRAAPRYRPPLLAIVGAATELMSRSRNRLGPWGGTWALYGFESVIWAKKELFVRR